MRIEYTGTPLESLLEYSKVRSIDFVYLDSSEFSSWRNEAKEKEILDREDTQWFTVKDKELVFYLEV